MSTSICPRLFDASKARPRSTFWLSVHLLFHRFSQSIRRRGVLRVAPSQSVVSPSSLFAFLRAAVRAQMWECWVAVNLPWGRNSPCAGRVCVNVAVHDLDKTDECDWGSSPTGCRFSMGPTSRSTRLSCPTLVSVLRRDGTPHLPCANEDGAALAQGRHRRELRWCWQGNVTVQSWWFWPAKSVGSQFLCQLATAKTRNETKVLRSGVALRLMVTRSTADVVWEARFVWCSFTVSW